MPILGLLIKLIGKVGRSEVWIHAAQRQMACLHLLNHLRFFLHKKRESDYLTRGYSGDKVRLWAHHSGPGTANQLVLLLGHLGRSSASCAGGQGQHRLSRQEGQE